jgi:hypothetical protein
LKMKFRCSQALAVVLLSAVVIFLTTVDDFAVAKHMKSTKKSKAFLKLPLYVTTSLRAVQMRSEDFFHSIL